MPIIKDRSAKLYNVRRDPSEIQDLAEELPELVDLLKEQFEKYMDQEAHPYSVKMVDIKDRSQNGYHGPGWCAVEDLQLVREESLKGTHDREVLPDACYA